MPIVGPLVNAVWLIADRHSPIFSISYPLAVAFSDHSIMVILAIQRSILVAQGLRPDEFFTLPRHAWTGTWRFYHFETMISIKSNISDTHMEEI